MTITGVNATVAMSVLAANARQFALRVKQTPIKYNVTRGQGASKPAAEMRQRGPRIGAPGRVKFSTFSSKPDATSGRRSN
jgi:hypothetical protein